MRSCSHERRYRREATGPKQNRIASISSLLTSSNIPVITIPADSPHCSSPKVFSYPQTQKRREWLPSNHIFRIDFFRMSTRGNSSNLSNTHRSKIAKDKDLNESYKETNSKENLFTISTKAAFCTSRNRKYQNTQCVDAINKYCILSADSTRNRQKKPFAPD